MILENKANEKTTIVALSGGVDSAVAALLLKRSGARLRAVFMRNWDDEDQAAGCHDKQDLLAAAAVADFLDLEFEIAEFIDDYRRRVFAPFLAELRRGRSPNPDILCNSEIKFAAFDDYARRQGAAAIATGHYARIDRLGGHWRLCRGEDSAKDQSYFLHRLTAAQLSRAVFPLARLHKAETREIARAAGLPNWSRKDSVGVCFIGERKFSAFLSRYLPEQPGDIVDINGRKVGRHNGLPFYTIGQRRGLRVGGRGGPWFVCKKDNKNNVLYVAEGENNPALFREEVALNDAHWVAGEPPPPQRVYEARLRHRQTPASCVLSEIWPGGGRIVFADPQRAAAPGQYAVVYDGNVCLGGGVIADFPADDDSGEVSRETSAFGGR